MNVNLTPYEKLALAQAIDQKLNNIRFSFKTLKGKTPIWIEEKVKSNYNVLISAAEKLDLTLENREEGLG